METWNLNLLASNYRFCLCSPAPLVNLCPLVLLKMLRKCYSTEHRLPCATKLPFSVVFPGSLIITSGPSYRMALLGLHSLSRLVLFCRNEEKVNEFLREISPMREAAFWHDFIGRCFLPENGTQDGIVNWQESKPRLRRHEINANINNNVHSVATSKKTKLTPPPLPPKPKLFKVSHNLKSGSCFALMLRKGKGERELTDLRKKLFAYEVTFSSQVLSHGSLNFNLAVILWILDWIWIRANTLLHLFLFAIFTAKKRVKEHLS